MPASLWAKSTITTRRPRRYTLSRPGRLRRQSGRKSRRPRRTASIEAPRARAPAAAASALATLWRASPPSAIGTSASRHDRAASVAPSASTSQPSRAR